jgi:hypothetical protein
MYKTFESLNTNQYQNTNNKVDNNDNNKRTNHNHVQINYNLIEKSIKVYKTHCNVKDFDIHFIKRLQLDEDQVSFIKDVVRKMKKMS